MNGGTAALRHVFQYVGHHPKLPDHFKHRIDCKLGTTQLTIQAMTQANSVELPRAKRQEMIHELWRALTKLHPGAKLGRLRSYSVLEWNCNHRAHEWWTKA